MRRRRQVRPLAGRVIVITRRQAQAGELRRALRQRGARVIELPTIALVPPLSWARVDRAVRQLSDYDWLIFTSANGVEAFLGRLRRRGKTAAALRGRKIAAIGPATAAALKRHGIKVDVLPKEFRAEGLLAAFRKVSWRGKRVLLARAAAARQVLPRELRRRGARVDVVAVYRTVAPRGSKRKAQQVFTRPKPDLITFTSSSTVKNFFSLLGRAAARRALAGVAVATIGPVTSKTARGLGLRVAVEADPYTVRGLVRGIEHFFRAKQRAEKSSSRRYTSGW